MQKHRSVAEMAREYLQMVTPEFKPHDKTAPNGNRIIQAGSLAEEGRKRLLIGRADEPGLRLPWPELDDRVRITPGKFVVWTGYMHHGKSQMLKQVMLAAMQQSDRVAIASMEEEPVELWCDMARMGCGTQDPHGARLAEWGAFCKSLWFYDEQGQAKTSQLKAAIVYSARELKINHFVIDSLMTTDIDKDDYTAQTRFARELKTLAKDEKITIHLVAHMRKRETRSGDEAKGGAQDIAGAHEIGSLADYVFTVWRDKRERGERPDGSKDALLRVEKQRGRFNWIGSFGLDFHHGSRQYVRGNEAMTFWEPRQREPGEDMVEL